MQTDSFIITGSTLAEIPAVHEPVLLAHDHSRSAVRGYLVVRTSWDSADVVSREPIAFFAVEPEFRAGKRSYTHAYGEALDAVRLVRETAGPLQSGVIDWVYDCDCRLIG